MKHEKQINLLKAFADGRMAVEDAATNPLVLGSRGQPLAHDFSNGYARVTLNKNKKAHQERAYNYPVHVVIALWDRFQRVGGDINAATYPEGDEVDHINRDVTDNRIGNLRVVSRSTNQKAKRNKGHSPALPPEQRLAIQNLIALFPGVNRRLLATALGLSTGQLPP